MPLSQYFSGGGKEVMASMKKQYGSKKGESVFYATANKMKKKKKKKTLWDMMQSDGEYKNA